MARKVEKLSPAAVKNAPASPACTGMAAVCGSMSGRRPGRERQADKDREILDFPLHARRQGQGDGAGTARHDLGCPRHAILALACLQEGAWKEADPLEVRLRQAEGEEAGSPPRRPSPSKACAGKYITANKASWPEEKHRPTNGRTSLTTYVLPIWAPVGIGNRHRARDPRSRADLDDRVRDSIPCPRADRSVLSYATTHGWRAGENPARWRGHLENVLPKKSKVAKVEHHAALPWRESGAFMKSLATEHGTGALAFQFAILTAARTVECDGSVAGDRHATRRLDHSGERMKAGVEHRVPLLADALSALST